MGKSGDYRKIIDMKKFERKFKESNKSLISTVLVQQEGVNVKKKDRLQDILGEIWRLQKNSGI